MPRGEDRRSIERSLRQALRANERAEERRIREVLTDLVRRRVCLIGTDVAARSRSGTMRFSDGTSIAVDTQRGDRALRSLARWMHGERTTVVLVECETLNARWHRLRFQTSRWESQDAVVRLLGAGQPPRPPKAEHHIT